MIDLLHYYCSPILSLSCAMWPTNKLCFEVLLNLWRVLLVFHLGAGALQGKKCVITMVHFKNRYMVMEVFIDAGLGEQDPVILTQFNITKVIRDSIQLNFGECGLATSIGSLQGATVTTRECILFYSSVFCVAFSSGFLIWKFLLALLFFSEVC